jgi:hypothetical protein
VLRKIAQAPIKKQIKNRIMIRRTVIVRDSDYSFMELSQKDADEIIHRKIEKGSADYTNACSLFYKNNIEVKKGNKIGFKEG